MNITVQEVTNLHSKQTTKLNLDNKTMMKAKIIQKETNKLKRR